MPPEALPIGYAIISVLLVRASTRSVWRTMCYGDLEWFDVCMSLLFGCLLAAIWPVWVPFALIRSGMGTNVTAAQFFATVAGESRSEKLKRKDREMAEREAHIAKLERELGIDGDDARPSLEAALARIAEGPSRAGNR